MSEVARTGSAMRRAVSGTRPARYLCARIYYAGLRHKESFINPFRMLCSNPCRHTADRLCRREPVRVNLRARIGSPPLRRHRPHQTGASRPTATLVAMSISDLSRFFRAAGVVILTVFAIACSRSKPAAAPVEEKAPATFRVNLDTSRGPVVMEITRELAPNGADRFYSLVRAKYFDGARFYRVVPGFVVQWGGAADPALSKLWDVPIPDDPVGTTNARGTVTFAASNAPSSRTTHLFINLADNQRLDSMHFAPIGKVVSGMENVDQIYSGYGERPDQQQIAEQGNAYLEKEFPNLDYIKTARVAQ